jgi:hypothetical protein
MVASKLNLNSDFVKFVANSGPITDVKLMWSDDTHTVYRRYLHYCLTACMNLHDVSIMKI